MSSCASDAAMVWCLEWLGVKAAAANEISEEAPYLKVINRT